MKKTWYNRMLLSYLPIYLFISSVIILMTFLMISRLSQKEAENANRMYVEQQVELLDRSLRSIDNMLIKELQFDDVIIKYFSNEVDPTYLLSYNTSEKINQLRSTDPLIDSIYLYRFSDQMVMSPNTMIPLDKFEDRNFADSFRGNNNLYTLSDERQYTEFIDQTIPVSVISIVRKFPLLGGKQGIIVVNVSIPKLQRWLEDLSRSDRNYFYIVSKQGNTLAGINLNGIHKGTELSRVQSEYTGWVYVGGVMDGHLYQYASVLTYIWLICGFIIVGFLWIMFITKRNYKPIETIMDRIHLYSMQKSSKLTSEKDEFKFIDQALEALIERSQTYQRLHEEDVDIRKRQLFHDLVEGNRTLTMEAWHKEAPAYHLPSDFSRIGLAVFEIDRFGAWSQTYNTKDQYLLKFVLSSVVSEIAENSNNTGIWSEWIAHHRLAVFYFFTEEQQNGLLHSLAEQVRCWVEGNLAFTITIGLSRSEGTIEELPSLHDEAVEALSFKGSIGINQVLSPPYRQSQGEPYKHIQNIRSFTQAYRLLEPKWKDMFLEIFEEIRQDLLNREEHINLMNYLIYQLNKEMNSLSPEVVAKWSSVFYPKLSETIEQLDLMEELQQHILEILETLEGEIQVLRENRSNSVLARNIRRYIELNHANPDLSLNHLCEEFGLNGKYISRMFKEEFGEKLVEYMVHIRIEKSKELLTSTTLSVQEVAQSVGYVHDISFIRSFKKVVGQTPGEYRKS